jgi:hypothetical protein
VKIEPLPFLIDSNTLVLNSRGEWLWRMIVEDSERILKGSRVDLPAG